MDYEWDYEVEEVGQVEQRVLGPKNFITDDEAERRAFEIAKRLLEEEAKAKQRRDKLEACLKISVIREYEQWLTETDTHHMKREVLELDDE
jgi:hypothetical protein